MKLKSLNNQKTQNLDSFKIMTKINKITINPFNNQNKYYSLAKHPYYTINHRNISNIEYNTVSNSVFKVYSLKKSVNKD